MNHDESLDALFRKLRIRRIFVIDTSRKEENEQEEKKEEKNILREVNVENVLSLLVAEIARARKANKEILELRLIKGTKRIYVGAEADIAPHVPTPLLRFASILLKDGQHTVWGLWEHAGQLGFLMTPASEERKHAKFITVAALYRRIKP